MRARSRRTRRRRRRRRTVVWAFPGRKAHRLLSSSSPLVLLALLFLRSASTTTTTPPGAISPHLLHHFPQYQSRRVTFFFYFFWKKICCEKFRPRNETLAGEQALIVAWTLNRGSKPFLNKEGLPSLRNEAHWKRIECFSVPSFRDSVGGPLARMCTYFFITSCFFFCGSVWSL